MNEHEAIPQDEGRSDGIMALFLGLYLLVLAFFILLVTISTREDVKATAVMDSLSATFSTVLPPSRTPTAFTARENSIQAGHEFQERVTRLFATALKVAKVESVQPGRLMRVMLPSDSLFFPGEAKIRDSRYPLLDRMVAAISGRPPGVRFDMDFVIGIAKSEDGTLPVGQTLEMARAGAFAREMQSRGAPSDSISIAVKPGDGTDVVIWFHVRILDELRINFQGEANDE